jgi:hypothetical protein
MEVGVLDLGASGSNERAEEMEEEEQEQVMEDQQEEEAEENVMISGESTQIGVLA